MKLTIQIVLFLLAAIAIFVVGIFTGMDYTSAQEVISITMRLPSGSRWNYSAYQSILEAYQIEAIGREWNKGERWTGKHLEALIRQNAFSLQDSMLLDSILPLKPGQRIVFSDAD